jgi:aryl-alcohol dehydrogenase-like predicted oxidoreductase
MNHRRLPGTDLDVSEVCLGTMTWGEQNSEAEAHAQLDHAIAHGVNFIDTAEMYPVPPNATTQGRTETFLGRWLARRGRSGLVIASKVAGPGRRDWVRGGRTDLTAANIREAAETSLMRLGLEHLDLFQIHWPQRNVPNFGQSTFDRSKEKSPPGPSIHEQVEGMAALVRAGKIRWWGLSNETSWGVCAFRQAARELGVPGPVTLQNSYSLLSGKYRGGVRPPGSRFALFDTLGIRFRKPVVPEAIEAWLALAERRGITPVQLALGWVRTRDVLGAQIIGATSLAQLEEDLAAAQFALDAGTLEEIDRLLERYPNPAP